MLKTEDVKKRQPGLSATLASLPVLGPPMPEHPKDILKMTARERRRKLGQVFTEEGVADFMASECIVAPHDRGFDPCYGEGQLLVAAAAQLARLAPRNRTPDYARQLHGIEIDPHLFSVGYHRLASQVHECKLPGLHAGDFFELEPPRQLFDFVIMNPPYVRQEQVDKAHVSSGGNFGTGVAGGSTGSTVSQLPGRSNLYSYFFAGITRFLRPGGRLVAITYDSWLFTRFGETLQTMFLRDYNLLKVIRLSGSAFDNASIDTCIVMLEKKPVSDETSVATGRVAFVKAEVRRQPGNVIGTSDKKVVHVVSTQEILKADLSVSRRWDVFFRYPPFHAQLMQTARWARLDTCCSVKRGAEPLSASFFVRDMSVWKSLGISRRWLTPIIKDPTRLEHMNTAGRSIEGYYLCLQFTKQELFGRPGGPAVVHYLERIEHNLLLAPNRRRGLVRAVQNAPDSWFIHATPDVADIFFSYIMRRRKIFLINDGRVPTTDNFANLFTHVPLLALFAVLNGTFVRYQIEVYARRQGSGLSKLQIFELAAIPIPDLLGAPTVLIAGLEEVGKRLMEMPATVEGSNTRSALVADIDRVLWPYMGIDRRTARAIASSERQLTRERLDSDFGEA